MATLEDLRRGADMRGRDNAALSKAYSDTLWLLTPANFVLVVGAALLSLVAGASLLKERGYLNPTESGILALISAAFTVIHSKLGCEQYQAECKKLMSFHRGLAADYANLSTIDDLEDLRKRFNALNDQVSATLKSTTWLPFGFTMPTPRKHV